MFILHNGIFQLENQVLFLHEEFSKQVAFPRKALETEFSYFDSIFGDEMNGIDVTHKHVWIQVWATTPLIYQKISKIPYDQSCLDRRC